MSTNAENFHTEVALGAKLPGSFGLLVMDFQAGICAGLPESERATLLSRIEQALEFARSNPRVKVYHVHVCFRQGHPEVKDSNKVFSGIKAGGVLVQGTPSSAPLPGAEPLPDEPVFYKRRIGAFSTTDLETVLRADGIDTLLVTGVTTTGVVTSTCREAADKDFITYVLDDLIADWNPEAHQALTKHILPMTAYVVSSKDIFKMI